MAVSAGLFACGNSIVKSNGVFATNAEWSRATALLNRYHRFVKFTEGWQPTGKSMGYADNSTEVEERNRAGAIRWRMAVAPSGDASF